MSRQYKRNYRLTISSDDGTVSVIKALRIKFNIVKSTLSSPNVCRLEIYNPNIYTLSSLQRKFTHIHLEVGYGDDLKTLFVGQLVNVIQGRDNVDRIITVYAGDGQKAWQNSIINKTFKEGIDTKQVINELVESFSGVELGDLTGIPQASKDKVRGRVLSGSSSEIMDGYADQYGFDWNIQDNEINVISKDEISDQSSIVVLNSASGMIGSPAITQIGVEVTSLLNPNLVPNKSIKIESLNAEVRIPNLEFIKIKRTSAEGTYKIAEVTFTGDTHSDDWKSKIIGRLL